LDEISQQDAPVRIFIVDDDASTVFALTRLLRVAGYLVVGHAATGDLAMQVLADVHPDLILMDINLPGTMDGVQTVEHIQRTFDVPIIYLTGMADETTLTRAKRTGPFGYLVKPVDAPILHRTIEIALYKYALDRRLKESELFNRTVITSVGEGVIVYDTELCYRVWNPFMETLTGVPAAEILGESALEVFPHLQAQGINHLLEQALAGEEVHSPETPFSIPETGRRGWVVGTYMPHLDVDGNIQGVVATIRDVTEQVEARLALQEAHAQLEQRVVERTQELAEANVQLRQEITERERAEVLLRRYANEQAALYTVAATTTGHLEPEPLLAAALEATLPAVGATAGWVMLAGDQGPGTLRASVWRGIPATLAETLAATMPEACPVCTQWLFGRNVPSKPTLLSDCPRLGAETLAGFGIGHVIGIPLRVARTILGILCVAWPTPPAEEALSSELLLAMGQQIGLALRNAQLYQVAREADRLETVNAIGTAAVSSLNLDEVLPHVLELTCFALDAEEGSILLRDPATEELVFAQTLSDASTALRGRRLAMGQGVAGWIAQQRRSVLINDVHRDGRWYAGLDLTTGFATQSLVGAPLIYHGELTGVLEVVNKQHGEFTADDVKLLEAVATIAAVAIENAQLFTAMQERVDELAELHANLQTALAEQEQTQAQLIQAEKMAALGRLAASIAHEINNPLQAVLGCLRLSEEELTGAFRQEKLERHLQVAVEEVRRVSAIVHRMHDFYRHARTELHPTDVHAALESVLELSQKQLQHSQVVVQREFTATTPVLHANSDHLKQVFLNLLINAVDAMPDGGVLRIATAVADLPPTVSISFSDTGIGMSPETLAHLFEPFFTTKPHGSGLGLSISYGIIEPHNGKIEVESHLGKGTTFTIALPMTQPQ
jgi:two-component system NtrC family sensor kinase